MGKYETMESFVAKMEREEEDIPKTLVASMMHDDQKKMGENLSISDERLRYSARQSDEKWEAMPQ